MYDYTEVAGKREKKLEMILRQPKERENGGKGEMKLWILTSKRLLVVDCRFNRRSGEGGRKGGRKVSSAIGQVLLWHPHRQTEDGKRKMLRAQINK